MVNSPSTPQSFTLTSSPANNYARPCRLCSNQKEIRAGPDSGYPVFQNPFKSGLGEASLPESKAWEIVARARHLSSLHVLTYTQVSQLMGSLNWASGLIPGSFVPETPPTSFSLFRSDRLVYATTSIRPSGPCQPSAALAGPAFSYLRNPNPHVSGGFHDFYGRLHAGVGRSQGGFPDFRYSDPYRPQAPHQLFGAQGGSLCPTALGSSAPEPPGYDRYGQFDSSTCIIYQQARRDPFPTLLRLTVELLLWLEAQNIIVQARHIPGCLNVIADHLSRPNQPISTEWSLHPEIVKRIFRVVGHQKSTCLQQCRTPTFLGSCLQFYSHEP